VGELSFDFEGTGLEVVVGVDEDEEDGDEEDELDAGDGVGDGVGEEVEVEEIVRVTGDVFVLFSVCQLDTARFAVCSEGTVFSVW
jgi:hypothetical protein